MAKAKQIGAKDWELDRPMPSLDPDVRQNQMIALAVEVAEEQLLNRTASSQVITHYLKLAAEREKAQLELQILEKQKALLDAKTEALRAEQSHNEVYQRAIDAMRLYTGGQNDPNVY